MPNSPWGVLVNWPAMEAAIKEEAFIRWGTNEGTDHVALRQIVGARCLAALEYYLQRFPQRWSIQNPYGRYATFNWQGFGEWLIESIPAIDRSSDGEDIQNMATDAYRKFQTHGVQTSLFSKIALAWRPDYFIPYDETVRDAIAAYIAFHVNADGDVGQRFQQQHFPNGAVTLTRNYRAYFSVAREITEWLITQFGLNDGPSVPECCTNFFRSAYDIPMHPTILRRRIVDKYLMVVGGYEGPIGCQAESARRGHAQIVAGHEPDQMQTDGEDDGDRILPPGIPSLDAVVPLLQGLQYQPSPLSFRLGLLHIGGQGFHIYVYRNHCDLFVNEASKREHQQSLDDVVQRLRAKGFHIEDMTLSIGGLCRRLRFDEQHDSLQTLAAVATALRRD